MSGESEQGYRGDTTYGEPVARNQGGSPHERGTDLTHACALCGKPVGDGEATSIHLASDPVPVHPSCGRDEGQRMVREADEVAPVFSTPEPTVEELRALALDKFKSGTLVKYRGLNLRGVVMSSQEVSGDIVVHVGWSFSDHAVMEAHRIPARVSIRLLDVRERVQV